MLQVGRKKYCKAFVANSEMNRNHRWRTVLTKWCPRFLSCNLILSFLGLNYIIMGQVEEDGRGKIFPNSFVMSFKTKNSKILNALKNKTCQNWTLQLHSIICLEKSFNLAQVMETQLTASSTTTPTLPSLLSTSALAQTEIFACTRWKQTLLRLKAEGLQHSHLISSIQIPIPRKMLIYNCPIF